MATDKGYKNKHVQTYYKVNPAPFGANTWRMTMIPAFLDDPGDITSILTILPIDSREDTPDNVTLFFNIFDLPDVSDVSTYMSATDTARALLDLPAANRDSVSVQKISAVPPVKVIQQLSEAAIFFDISSLPSNSLLLYNYNSRSVDSLSADKPLFVTGDENSVVTFNINSLDPA